MPRPNVYACAFASCGTKAGTCSAGFAGSSAALALDYPTRLVRIVVPADPLIACKAGAHP